MTLVETLSRLTTLARDHRAVLTHTVQPELFNGGEGLLVFWEPLDGDGGHDDLPKEALLRFTSLSDDSTAATFTTAFVHSGRRFIQCRDDGLSEEQARRECRQLVSSIDSVCSYLTGHPYRVVPRGYWQAPYSALDTETEDV